MEIFLKTLPVVAGHPLALVAYVAVVIAWVVVTLQTRKSSKLFRTIKYLPESDRLEAIRQEYKTAPKAGLSSDQWLRSLRMKFLFTGFGLTLLTVVVLVAITFAQAQDIDEFLRRAEVLISNDRYIEAAEEAQGAIELDPNNPEGWHVLGIAKHWAGRTGKGAAQYQAGLIALTKARELVEGKESRYSYSLGSILAQMGRHEDALTYYEESLKLRPAKPVVIYAMGYSYRELGNIEKALEYYNDTIQLGSDFVPEAAFAVARIHAQSLVPGRPCPQDSDRVKAALRALSVMLENGGDKWAWILLRQAPRRGEEQLDPLRECAGFAELRDLAQKKLGIIK